MNDAVVELSIRVTQITNVRNEFVLPLVQITFQTSFAPRGHLLLEPEGEQDCCDSPISVVGSAFAACTRNQEEAE